MASQDLHAIAFDAYQYAYPLVMMDATMRQATNVPDAASVLLRAPINQLSHARAYPPADARDIVRYNFDTLYSFAWLDLRAEPMVLTVPESQDRYYVVPVLDMWTDTFAVFGSRTTFGRAGSFALAAPGWRGTVPGGVELVESPTPVVWVMGRTQTNGPADYAAVNAFQDRYAVTPLSAWGSSYAPPTSVPVAGTGDPRPPVTQVNSMTGVELLTRFAALSGTYRPHPNDLPILLRMRALGLRPGHPFDPEGLLPGLSEVIDAAAADALADLQHIVTDGTLGFRANGWNWTTDLGTYGTSYRLRAMVALAGLGANLAADAIYPNAYADADGKPLDGRHRYVLHFERDQLPQAEAFWSLTMYDDQSFQVPNELDRFAIGDRDPLDFGPDGSLDLFLQHDNPGPDRERNWLPAPEGAFQAMLRIYSPRPDTLRRPLDLPPIRRIDA